MIRASDFQSRDALEKHIRAATGHTTDKKNEKIQGTVAELAKLALRHGQLVWGVSVEAINYQPKNVVNHAPRGSSISALNGNAIKIKQ